MHEKCIFNFYNNFYVFLHSHKRHADTYEPIINEDVVDSTSKQLLAGDKPIHLQLSQRGASPPCIVAAHASGTTAEPGGPAEPPSQSSTEQKDDV
jgi:hypothetical protein